MVLGDNGSLELNVSVHTWLQRVAQDLINSLDWLVWGRMKDDDDGAKEAHRTT